MAITQKDETDDPKKKEFKKVESKTVIYVADVIDIKNYKGLKEDAKKLKKYGACVVYILANHYALEAQHSIDLLSSENIHKVIVTNTLPVKDVGSLVSKLKVIDISEAISTAMNNTKKSSKKNQNADGISKLMKDLSLKN